MRLSPRFRAFALAAAFVPALPAADAPLSALTYSGDQSALSDVDREIRLAGRDAAKLAALEKRLVAEFVKRDATFAARQAIAPRLALVLADAPADKSPAHRTLVALLADARDADIARLALQPVPGAAVDRLFVDALPRSSGRGRLGLLDAIGVRRIGSAVAAVAKLLADADAEVAIAAAHALGRIGNPAALTALRDASASAAPTVAPALFAARHAAATHLPAAAALAELRELQDLAAAPMPVRDAAFRTTLDLDPAGASSALAAALASPALSRRQVALEAVAASAAPNVVPNLTARLSTFAPETQAAVLAAFARSPRRDTVSVPALLGHAASSEAVVRAAAISTLGFLRGDATVVAALAKIAATSAEADAAEDARLARQALARLDGPGVSAAILAGAEKAATPLRAVFIELLALRAQTEALPLLLSLRRDPAAEIRLAAVAALGDLASADSARALLDWSIGATDEAEQSRALRSLVNVILREPAGDARGQLLFAAVESAKSDVAQRLLPALQRLGGRRSAETAATVALRDDLPLAAAATALLGRWPDASALPALATVAEKALAPATRDAARSAVLRHFERQRDPWSAEFTGVVKRLLAVAPAADRPALVRLLHRADDSAALELARSLASDAALAPTATIAADVIRANQAGAPRARVSSGSASGVFDRRTNTRWSVPALGEEWIEVDLRLSRPVSVVTLDQTTRANEFPERYEVHVTDDPKSPGPVVVSGKGRSGKTTIELPAGTRGRYVIVKNVAERPDSNWSVVELYID